MLIAASVRWAGSLRHATSNVSIAALLNSWCWEDVVVALNSAPTPAHGPIPSNHYNTYALEDCSSQILNQHASSGCTRRSTDLHGCHGTAGLSCSSSWCNSSSNTSSSGRYSSGPPRSQTGIHGLMSAYSGVRGGQHSGKLQQHVQHSGNKYSQGMAFQQPFIRGLSNHAGGHFHVTHGDIASSLHGVCSTTTWDAAVVGNAISTVPSSPSVVVGSSMEELAWEIFGPTQMGIQTWEMFHLGLGVPWWISIPVATLTIKLLLLPLTLKAKAASANFALAHQAWTESTQISSLMDPKPSRWEQWGIYLKSYRYLRKKYRTPRIMWYTINSLVQIPLFITLSLALRRMSTFSWPGLTNEGIFYFPDLTSPAVDLANWTAPYGPLGVFIPLGLLSLQMLALEYAAAARSPPLRSALELSSLTYFLAALSVPHATLLYWLTNSCFHVGLQHALSKPQAARALGLPMLLVNTRSEKDGKLRQELEREEEQDSLKDSMDVGFLLPLGEDTLVAGNSRTALACFEKVLQQEPNNVKALLGKSRALFTLQRWQDAHAALRQYQDHAADEKAWTTAYQQIATSLLASAQTDLTTSSPGTSPSSDGTATESSETPKPPQTHVAKLEAAVQLLQHMTDKMPDDVEAWMALGAARSLMGNTAGFLQAVDKAYSSLTVQNAEQENTLPELRERLEGLLRNAALELQQKHQSLPTLSPEVSKLLSDQGSDEKPPAA